uniref:Uncharacterized protein n=1 Tax=Utricularia reniformis TaxID=192314 RepID=A0A1Y0B1Q8_9LAMI|nr:hypothetical protein AEK19_MT1134 [Utricularia reniformis]ART31350.1 hypothetical protein AEK19_MT1134 [Utricularia reniformis]
MKIDCSLLTYRRNKKEKIESGFQSKRNKVRASPTVESLPSYRRIGSFPYIKVLS